MGGDYWPLWRQINWWSPPRVSVLDHLQFNSINPGLEWQSIFNFCTNTRTVFHHNFIHNPLFFDLKTNLSHRSWIHLYYFCTLLTLRDRDNCTPTGIIRLIRINRRNDRFRSETKQFVAGWYNFASATVTSSSTCAANETAICPIWSTGKQLFDRFTRILTLDFPNGKLIFENMLTCQAVGGMLKFRIVKFKVFHGNNHYRI